MARLDKVAAAGILLAGWAAAAAPSPVWTAAADFAGAAYDTGEYRERGDFSWCAWVDLETAGKEKAMLFRQKGFDTALSLTGGEFSLEFWPDHPGSFQRISARAPSGGKWCFVAAVMDAKRGAASLYLNGRLSARTLFDGVQRRISRSVQIGEGNAAKAMKNAVIYSAALGGADIVGLMESTAQGREVAADAPERPVPVYCAKASSPERIARLREELPRRLADARRRRSEWESRLAKLLPEGGVRKERVGYRMEILDGLLRFIARELESGEDSGLFYAELGLEDADNLFEYFKLEAKYAAVPAPRRLNVRDFGAAGDGKANDSAAFKRAFDAAAKLAPAPVEVFVPGGTYLLQTAMEYGVFVNEMTGQRQDDGKMRRAHIALNGCENLTISGEKDGSSRIVFGEFNLAGFRLSHSKNCTVRNLEFKWKKTTCLQGVVTDFDPKAKTVDVLWDPASMHPSDPDFADSQRTTTYYDAKGDLVKSGLTFWDGKFTDIGVGRIFRLSFTRAPQHIGKGYTITVAARNNWFHGFNFTDCTLCTAENVTLRNSRSAGFSAYGRFGTLAGCRLKPEDGILLCTCADGLFCSTGTAMFRCDFERTSDDGVNSHSGGRFLAAIRGNSAVGWQAFVPGQILRMVDPFTGQTYVQSRVKSASRPVKWGNRPETLYETELEEIHNRETPSWESLGKTTGYASRNGAYVKPGERLPAQIYASGNYGQVATVVVSNRFSNIRSSGIVVQSPNTLIRGNRVFNPSWQALRVGALLNYGEGPAPYHVQVKDNVFERSSDGIVIQYLNAAGASASAPAMRALAIDGNTLKSARPAFNLLSVGDSSVSGNRVEDDRPVFVRIGNAHNLKFEGNTFNGEPISPADVIRQ